MIHKDIEILLPAWYSSKWQKNAIFKKFSKGKYESLAIIFLQILKGYNFLDLSTKFEWISRNRINFRLIHKSIIYKNGNKVIFLINSLKFCVLEKNSKVLAGIGKLDINKYIYGFF